MDEFKEQSAVATAVANGNLETISAFINAHDNWDTIEFSYEYTLLSLAAHRKQKKSMQLLLQHNPSPLAKNIALLKLLEDHAIDPLFVQLLLENGANANAGDRTDSVFALHKAATWPTSTCTELLVQHGANVNAQMDDGNTPLHIRR